MAKFKKNEYLMMAHPAGDVKVRFLSAKENVAEVEHFGSKLQVALADLRRDSRIGAGGIIKKL